MFEPDLIEPLQAARCDQRDRRCPRPLGEAGRQLGALSRRLLDAGWPADTPVLVVSQAGTPDQRASDHEVATLAAASTPWLGSVLGWGQAMALWALPAVLAALLWQWRAPADCQQHAAVASHIGRMFGRRRAWSLALYFGIGTGVYVCTLAWLAPFFVFLGYSSQQAGLMLSYMTAFEVATGLLLPLLAARHSDARPWLLATLAANLLGLAGLAWLPGQHSLLFVALLGAGIGGLFPLTMILTL